MKRTMLVTNSLTGGGAERSMNLIANEMTRRGWSIALVPVNSSPPDQVVPTCEVFPMNRKWRGNPANLIATLWKFQKIVKSWKPDVLVLNCDLPEFIGALSYGGRNIVVVEHSTFPWVKRKKLGKVIRAILLRRNAKWIAVSEHLKVWPDDRVPLMVIPNPLLFSKVDQLDPSFRHIDRLVFIGRLSMEKRPDLFIQISNSVNIDCLLVGDGPMRQGLEETAANASNSVSFAGHVVDPWRLTQPGDLLIVPSLTEGDGLVVLEALARNVPLLVSDISDFRRFGFPDLNYCKDGNQFVSHIRSNLQDIHALVVPPGITEDLIRSRDVAEISDIWATMIDNL